MGNPYAGRKFISSLLVALILVSLLPARVEAANYDYRFGVKTADESYAGTDGWVYVGLEFYNGDVYELYCDSSANDHERGDYRIYGWSKAEERPPYPPWMASWMYNYKHGYDDWKCEYVHVFLTNYSGSHSTSNYIRLDIDDWFSDRKMWRSIGLETKRRITNYHGFQNWGGTYYLDKNSKSTISNSWNRQITDQYGTYNVMAYHDDPNMTYYTTPSISTSGWLTFQALLVQLMDPLQLISKIYIMPWKTII